MTEPSERWERAQEFFLAMRDLSDERREALLREACKDVVLREEVRALVRAHDALESGAGGGFLEALDARASMLLAGDDENDDWAEPEELSAGTTLGRYRIVRRIGHGGMGVVYLARDVRFGRPVALKVLSRPLSLDETARRRFEEEARAASTLDHPHIATVYDIDETNDGRIYLALAYYEGETLRQKLECGPLSIPGSVVLAGQIARGLEAAHGRGIVHRDVKPGNVIVTRGGVAKIVDFGIAKIAGSTLTRASATPGTVAYMSPEQTRGETVDPRTDLWSLGVVLYEMLGGRRPFRADHEQALVYAIRHDEPEPLGRIRLEVPEALQRVVERCLRKDPGERYGSAGAFLADLRALESTSSVTPLPRRRWRPALVSSWIVLAVLVLSLAGALVLRGPWTRPDDVAGEPPPLARALATPRLAVLPFTDLSPDPEDAYLADGLTEELNARLSKLRDLRVVARASTMRFAGSEKGVGEIGRELGVGAVLEGSVRKIDDQVRVTVRLVDARTEAPLWSEVHEAEMEDLPDVQREIAEGVAEALRVRIESDDGDRLVRMGTANPETYEQYLRGRHLLEKWDGPSARAALTHFRQALDREPTYADAWGGLATAYHVLARLKLLPAEDAYPRVRGAAERALALDPELAEAHAALALAHSYYYWDFEAAERHFRRALQLDPNDAAAHGMYAEHLRNQGHYDRALVEVRAAQELDPLSPVHRLEEGIVLYLARRFDEASRIYRRLLEADPGHQITLFFLAKVMIEQGRYEEALEALDEMDPARESPAAWSLRGYVYAVTGRSEEAREMLDKLNDPAGISDATTYQAAVIHVGLGEKDRALELLWRTYRDRAWPSRLLKVDPLFDPLRPDPRYGELLAAMGLQE